MVASVRMGGAEDDGARTKGRSGIRGWWLLFEWGRPRTTALRQKSVRVLGDGGFCSNGAAEDGRAPTEERSCIRGWWLLFEWGGRRTTAPGQKGVRVLGDGGFCSNGGGRGRPRSDRRAFVY